MIVTDGWGAYGPACRELGYQHRIVNHSECFVSPEGFYTNKVENLLRQIKKYYKEGNGIVKTRMENFLIG